MKSRITITTDNDTVTRIATVEDRFISYTESPGIKVVLEIGDEMLVVRKSGQVNMVVKHKPGHRETIDYQINLNGNDFFGNVEIKTTSLNISDNLIEVEFEREGEHVFQKWEIE